MTVNQVEHHALVLKRLLLLGCVFSIFGAVIFILWFVHFRFYETTDDCYISGNKVIIQSQINGTVKAYYTDDTDFVTEGQLLVELDQTEYLIEFDNAKANLALTLRNVLTKWYEYTSAACQVQERTAEYQKATIDFECRTGLLEQGAVSKEEYYDYKLIKEIAYHTLERAKQDYDAKKILIDVPDLLHHPLIEEAKDKLRRAYLDLYRCKIYAPTSGYIAERTVQVGQSVEKTTSLLAIIPLDQIWVEANYKETQLAHVRINQPVKITSDLWGNSITYTGKVIGIVPGTGNVFSILPPQNATGNWIKIVQRVPVRIEIDQEMIKKYPLWLGLSMTSTIATHDRNLEMLSYTQTPKKTTTPIFDKQLEDVENIIQSIIQANFSYPTTKE